MFEEKCYSSKSNYVLDIIWLFILIKTIFAISRIEYLLVILAIIFVLVLIVKTPLTSEIAILGIYFSFFLLLQTMGLFQNFTPHSLRTIIGTFSGYIFLVFGFICTRNKIHLSYFNGSYILLLVSLLVNKGFRWNLYSFENVGSGLLVFIFCIHSIVVIEKKRSNSFTQNVIIILSYFVTFLVIWMSKARTSLLSLTTILFIFFCLNKSLWCRRNIKLLFVILVCLIAIITISYMFIGSLPFYEQFNEISFSLFKKELNTSRPDLWKFEIARLQGSFLGGLGTGILPIFPYGVDEELLGSFHNSFIQLLMQNGFIGLVMLIIILGKIWNQISKSIELLSIQFVIASFVGILLYNSFETTLLSNKFSIGMLEWMILGSGLGISNINQKNLIGNVSIINLYGVKSKN